MLNLLFLTVLLQVLHVVGCNGLGLLMVPDEPVLRLGEVITELLQLPFKLLLLFHHILLQR